MTDKNTPLPLDVLDDIDLFLDQLDEMTGLECNATTDLLSYELEREGVSHTRMCGSTRQLRSGDTVFPHCWIELADGQVLDVRLSRYFPYTDDVPHGRFQRTEGYVYNGEESIDTRLEEALIRSLAE